MFRPFLFALAFFWISFLPGSLGQIYRPEWFVAPPLSREVSPDLSKQIQDAVNIAMSSPGVDFENEKGAGRFTSFRLPVAISRVNATFIADIFPVNAFSKFSLCISSQCPSPVLEPQHDDGLGSCEGSSPLTYLNGYGFCMERSNDVVPCCKVTELAKSADSREFKTRSFGSMAMAAGALGLATSPTGRSIIGSVGNLFGLASTSQVESLQESQDFLANKIKEDEQKFNEAMSKQAAFNSEVISNFNLVQQDINTLQNNVQLLSESTKGNINTIKVGLSVDRLSLAQIKITADASGILENFNGRLGLPPNLPLETVAQLVRGVSGFPGVRQIPTPGPDKKAFLIRNIVAKSNRPGILIKFDLSCPSSAIFSYDLYKILNSDQPICDANGQEFSVPHIFDEPALLSILSEKPISCRDWNFACSFKGIKTSSDSANVFYAGAVDSLYAPLSSFSGNIQGRIELPPVVFHYTDHTGKSVYNKAGNKGLCSGQVGTGDWLTPRTLIMLDNCVPSELTLSSENIWSSSDGPLVTVSKLRSAGFLKAMAPGSSPEIGITELDHDLPKSGQYFGWSQCNLTNAMCAGPLLEDFLLPLPPYMVFTLQLTDEYKMFIKNDFADLSFSYLQNTVSVETVTVAKDLITPVFRFDFEVFDLVVDSLKSTVNLLPSSFVESVYLAMNDDSAILLPASKVKEHLRCDDKENLLSTSPLCSWNRYFTPPSRYPSPYAQSSILSIVDGEVANCVGTDSRSCDVFKKFSINLKTGFVSPKFGSSFFGILPSTKPASNVFCCSGTKLCHSEGLVCESIMCYTGWFKSSNDVKKFPTRECNITHVEIKVSENYGMNVSAYMPPELGSTVSLNYSEVISSVVNEANKDQKNFIFEKVTEVNTSVMSALNEEIKKVKEDPRWDLPARVDTHASDNLARDFSIAAISVSGLMVMALISLALFKWIWESKKEASSDSVRRMTEMEMVQNPVRLPLDLRQPERTVLAELEESKSSAGVMDSKKGGKEKEMPTESKMPTAAGAKAVSFLDNGNESRLKGNAGKDHVEIFTQSDLGATGFGKFDNYVLIAYPDKTRARTVSTVNEPHEADTIQLIGSQFQKYVEEDLNKLTWYPSTPASGSIFPYFSHCRDSYFDLNKNIKFIDNLGFKALEVIETVVNPVLPMFATISKNETKNKVIYSDEIAGMFSGLLGRGTLVESTKRLGDAKPDLLFGKLIGLDGLAFLFLYRLACTTNCCLYVFHPFGYSTIVAPEPWGDVTNTPPHTITYKMMTSKYCLEKIYLQGNSFSLLPICKKEGFEHLKTFFKFVSKLHDEISRRNETRSKANGNVT